MTTAHRPTWAPAVGGEEQGGARWFVKSKQVSSKNAPGQTTLKFRVEGQGTGAEVNKRDLRAELEAKELKHRAKVGGAAFEEERQRDLLLLEAGPGDGGRAAKQLVPKAIDADEEDGEVESSSDADDDEDDEEELRAELDRIKKERAEEAAKRARAEAERAHKEKEQELKTGNPLLPIAHMDAAFAIKRRWDDDVKRFINDTIRSDFHKRFLNKYVR
ncbi:MAG: hypothetical protein WDW36_004920 [Sanguina aurantia]